jgi:hypothetical protein
MILTMIWTMIRAIAAPTLWATAACGRSAPC